MKKATQKEKSTDYLKDKYPKLMAYVLNYLEAFMESKDVSNADRLTAIGHIIDITGRDLWQLRSKSPQKGDNNGK